MLIIYDILHTNLSSVILNKKKNKVKINFNEDKLKLFHIKFSKYNMQLMLKYMNIKFGNELIFLYDGWKLFFPKKYLVTTMFLFSILSKLFMIQHL